jgi:molybdenum cofactor cytidylyltransferase
MGQPKQLLPVNGKPLLQHAIDGTVGRGLDEVILVLGHSAQEIARVLRLPANGRVVVNPEYRAGQASSLRAGLRASSKESEAAVIVMGDQPFLRSDVIEDVVEVYRHTGGPVVRAVYGDQPGHPVLIDRKVWEVVVEEGGDTGARDALARHPEWVVSHHLEGPPPPEVDTPEEYRRLIEATSG